MKNSSPKDYTHTLKLFSETIFALNPQHVSHLKHHLQASSLHRFVTYQKNIFGLVLKNLTSDFPVLYKYTGHNNFRYLCKEFISNNKIHSENIFHLAPAFVEFLTSYSLSLQDSLLKHIAHIDHLFTHHQQHPSTQLKLPLGVVSFWQRLYDDHPVENIHIDHSQYEWLYLRVKHNKVYLLSRPCKDSSPPE